METCTRVSQVTWADNDWALSAQLQCAWLQALGRLCANAATNLGAARERNLKHSRSSKSSSAAAAAAAPQQQHTASSTAAAEAAAHSSS
jgi:hypothetical protein